VNPEVGDDVVHDFVHDLVVVGGGITGLAAAFYALQASPTSRVVVLEAGPQAGGKVSSVRLCGREIDAGPDAFLARVSGAIDLAADLGLADELVAPATGQAWLWSRNQLHSLPAGLVLGVPSDYEALAASGILSPGGLLRAGSGFAGDADLPLGDISVAEGIGAHLGAEVVDRLVDPLLGGINASDCTRLSLKSASLELFAASGSVDLMSALKAQASSRGQIGVTEDRPVFLTPRNGVHQLIRSLMDSLGVRVRLNAPVTALQRENNRWHIDVGGERIVSQKVILATPAATAARLLGAVAPTLAGELASIRTASVALTLLAYPRNAVTLPAGSGMLVARPDGHLLTAASWWSQKWPHLDTGDQVIIRASAGRDGDERFRSMTDSDLIDALHAELVGVLDIRSLPAEAVVSRWIDGFPQYDVGHADRVTQIESLCSELPGLSLAGASYRGIGLPACIRDAKVAAAR
jgi:protoporphyrinogen/coproporphyrinogen III oxidase